MNRALLAGWLAVCVATASCRQETALQARLRSFGEELANATGRKGEYLPADSDLDLLEEAQIDLDGFRGGDLAGLVLMLRFNKSLADDDLAAVTDYAAGAKGQKLAGPLSFLLALRGRMDAAARLTVAWQMDVPKEQRSHSTWKRWEMFFGDRSDADSRSHRFSLALLKCFETGTAAEQGVVADLLDQSKLTVAQLPALRSQIEQQWRQQQAELAKEPPARKVWIEDRKGLRQIEVKGRIAARRYEVRLQRPVTGGAGSEVWGVLTSRSHYARLQASHLLLRHLAGVAQDGQQDLEPGVGPIAVVLRPQEEPDQLRSRIDDLGQQVGNALAAGTFAFAMASWQLPPEPGRAARARVLVHDVVSAVRRAAQRLHALAGREARRKPPDAAGDGEVFAALRAVTDTATAWIGTMAAEVPPALGGTATDMTVTGEGQRQWRTHVRFADDTVTVAEFAVTPPADGASGVSREMQAVTLQPEDLRGARYESLRSANAGSFRLRVATARSVLRQSASLNASDMYAGADTTDQFVIYCDTEAHRAALMAELQRLGERR